MKNFIKSITDRIRRKPLLVKPVVITRYFKCFKCGCITKTSGDLPEYICVNSAPYRTSGMCGGAFTIEITPEEMYPFNGC